MKNHYVLFFILSTIILITNCKKDALGDNPSLDEMEKYIRKSMDSRATYTYAQYQELLGELTHEKYIVLPLNEMKDTINASKVIIGMRHDIDSHIFKALEMAKLESIYGIRATYYILATSPYYGKFTDNGVKRYTCMERMYQDISNLHHEIGIHNDLLTVMIKYNIEPLTFNQDEMKFYKTLNIQIEGTSSHGSPIAQQTVSNYQIFSDFAKAEYVEYGGKQYEIGSHSLQEFGFKYEAYFINDNKYYSESNGKWNVEEGEFNQFMNELKNSIQGDRIQILTHPVRWGK